jgi:enoyl-CoA hydratase/carnithine racemase
LCILGILLVTTECLTVERKGPVTWLTLNRPEVLNAINPRMHQELEVAFDAFAADDSQRLCVLTGAGERAFSSGSDLKAGARAAGFSYPPHGYGGLVERFDLFKPVLAAVDGVCLGGGFELALACDLIIASERASFGVPEPRVGAIAVAGGLHRLVRQIGLKAAMGYMLTGAPMSAAEALNLGLINEVAPVETFGATVQRWCDAILACAPLAIQATKEVVMRGLDEPDLASALRRQRTYPGYERWWQAEDTREGPRAFAEKRAPRWQGR